MEIILHPVCRFDIAHQAGVENHHIKLFRFCGIAFTGNLAELGLLQPFKAVVLVIAYALGRIAAVIPHNEQIAVCGISRLAPIQEIEVGIGIAHALIVKLFDKRQLVILDDIPL